MMMALTRTASMLRRAAGSAPSTSRLHHPPRGLAKALSVQSNASEKALHDDITDEKGLDFSKKTVAGEKCAFLTIDDHNITIDEMKMKSEQVIRDANRKFEKLFLEQKISTNLAMLQIRNDMIKDSADNHLKHYIDYAAADNELKLLKKKFESHKLKIKYVTTQGHIVGVKTYGWGAGALTAILARFLSMPKYLFKTNGKV